jgi:hypothetical protein
MTKKPFGQEPFEPSHFAGKEEQDSPVMVFRHPSSAPSDTPDWGTGGELELELDDLGELSPLNHPGFPSPGAIAGSSSILSREVSSAPASAPEPLFPTGKRASFLPETSLFAELLEEVQHMTVPEESHAAPTRQSDSLVPLLGRAPQPPDSLSSLPHARPTPLVPQVDSVEGISEMRAEPHVHWPSQNESVLSPSQAVMPEVKTYSFHSFEQKHEQPDLPDAPLFEPPPSLVPDTPTPAPAANPEQARRAVGMRRKPTTTQYHKTVSQTNAKLRTVPKIEPFKEEPPTEGLRPELTNTQSDDVDLLLQDLLQVDTDLLTSEQGKSRSRWLLLLAIALPIVLLTGAALYYFLMMQ